MRSNTGTLIVSAVVALAIGLGLGALLFGSSSSTSSASATSSASGTSSTTAADTRPISLPASLGDFRDIVEVMADKGGKSSVVSGRRQNEATVAAATQTAYSHAFGGAAAAYRAYSDSGLARLPYVIAVRAPAPGLTIGPVLNPKYLGLATSTRDTKTVGPVQCQILWSPPTLAGQTPAPPSEIVVGCQRSGPHLTVFVGGGGFTGPAGLAGMVALANSAWSAASAG
jgi:hypothetical protein